MSLKVPLAPSYNPLFWPKTSPGGLKKRVNKIVLVIFVKKANYTSGHYFFFEKSFPNMRENLVSHQIFGTKLSANLGLNMPLKLLEYLGTNSSPNLGTNVGIHQISGRIFGLFFGDFQGWEPRLYSKFEAFQYLSAFSNLSARNHMVCHRYR